METGGISSGIKQIFLPAFEQLQTQIEDTQRTQFDLKQTLEKLGAEAAMIQENMQKNNLDKGLVKIEIQRKRMLMIEKRLALINEKLDQI
jgi:hypothetical protein